MHLLIIYDCDLDLEKLITWSEYDAELATTIKIIRTLELCDCQDGAKLNSFFNCIHRFYFHLTIAEK